jgi:CRP-like cAMP-binding protein
MSILETARSGNSFLDSLPGAMRQQVIDVASPVEMPVRAPVYEKGGPVDFAYFPVSGVISNVSTMSDGASIEVGIIGKEGMTGFPLVLTDAVSATHLYAQIGGTSLRVPKPAIVEIIRQSTESWGVFAAYGEAMISALSQYAACNRLHNIEERFARWLVMAHDRVRGDEIRLTQEFLSLMLGVRRAGVTLAASKFQEAGLIQYSRGTIVIRSRENLQGSACECYDTVEDRFAQLLGFSIRKYRAPSR